jgi:isopentenyldiphosphate isomerase
MPTSNPHALAKAQDDNEVFEVMKPPPSDFDMFQDKPASAGQTKTRHLVHRDQDWHRSVHVWIVDKQRKLVVMQKRSPQKDTYPNRWDISSAGHIEYGGDSKDTAIREVAEELGIQCSTDELLVGFTCPAQQAPHGCNCYEDVYFVARDKENCHFAIGEAEVTDVKWVEIDLLKQVLDDEDTDYVPRVKHYRTEFFKKLETICAA